MPATLQSPAVDEVLGLSDNDKRIIVGVVRDTYGVLLGKLKAHRGQLERELDGKPLKRDETSWIEARIQRLRAERLAASSKNLGARLIAAEVKAQSAETAYGAAQVAHTEAQAAFYDLRDSLLSDLEAVDEDGNSTFADKDRSSWRYKSFRTAGAFQATELDEIKAVGDIFQAAAKQLKPLDIKVAAAQRAVDQTERAYDTADSKFEDLMHNSGLFVSDGEIGTSAAVDRETAATATVEAEQRIVRIGELIEQASERSRTLRTEVAMSRLDSAEAEALLRAIPTDIEQLL